MAERKMEIRFGGGFMHVFEGQQGQRWASLTAGTVKAGPDSGFATHRLVLQHCMGSVETDLEPIPGRGDQAWDLADCRVEIEAGPSGSGVLAPLDATAPPPQDDQSAAWENWKWVVAPVALHRRLGHRVTPPTGNWRDKLGASVVIRSGVIVPEPGFVEVELTVAGHSESGPLTNETRWSSDPAGSEIVLYVTGKREGRLSIRPERDTVLMRFLHDEPEDVADEIRDLRMIYGLIDVAAHQRITKGVVKGVVKGAVKRTPGKTCASARFVAE